MVKRFRKMTFPNSKIELHQWFNSGLLIVVGFFAQQTYSTIQKDHDEIATIQTSIAVHEQRLSALEGINEKKEHLPYHISPSDAVLPNRIKISKEQ